MNETQRHAGQYLRPCISFSAYRVCVDRRRRIDDTRWRRNGSDVRAQPRFHRRDSSTVAVQRHRWIPTTRYHHPARAGGYNEPTVPWPLRQADRKPITPVLYYTALYSNEWYSYVYSIVLHIIVF